MIHSSGLVKRKHIIAGDDAKVVARLKNAGAIPIALTNVSELCMWWESANNVHGRSNNPYDVNRIVGGSSGGEGCAQAAAITAFGKILITLFTRMIHSSGLVKRKHIIAGDDAKVVARLKNAGAIPIALTNVSELCMWWESANNVHGRSNNPYDVNRIVGGSSGGEGCAQAAAITAFGIGSDIGGSIRMPSFFNGIFGHKPSPGVVPNHGQYPEPVTEEQNRFLGLGPMCRRAEDLLPLLKVISGPESTKLRLDEPVDVKKLKWFYQDNDSGSFMVSPVSREIRELFVKISQHLDKAYNIKATKVNYKKFAKSGPMWFANMKSPNGPTFDQHLADME
uniref:Fatty-acid amide hydrolase 2-like n=1 Tax=Diabrotica virgifera virgifera TaxID=50390 RepID=A0A6P7H3G0_DIAVI